MSNAPPPPPLPLLPQPPGGPTPHGTHPPPLPPPPPPMPPGIAQAILEDQEAEATEKKRKRDNYYDKPEDMSTLTARDDRTLMLRQLHPKTGDLDVFSMFSEVGTVVDVRLIIDERSGKCQGVGYVEMSDTAGMQAALALNGRTLCGQPIIVQTSLAEKNRMAAAGASAAQIKNAVGFTLPPANADGGIKLYVGGLDYMIDEAALRAIFEPFGELEKVDLHRETSGQSKGFGFVHFKKAADGRKCMEQLDGFALAGRPIKVSVSQADQLSNPAAALIQQQLGQLGALQPLNTSGSGGGEKASGLDSLDGEAVGGKMSASQRANVMAKLAQNAGMDVPAETRKAAATVGAVGGAETNSRCVVLKNMFDRLSEEATSNPEFFTELAVDVRGECAKQGTVLHTAADKWSNGFVYVKMLAHSEAQKVKDLMHGRYFSKNKIIADFVEEKVYDKKFKLVLS